MLDGRLETVLGDEQAIALIAERVIGELRGDLEVILADLSAPPVMHDQLTVEQVAKQFGVARSTVYAHWREWGGYKLGAGPKARIRFDGASLPLATSASKKPRSASPAEAPPRRSARRRRRRDLLLDAPRLAPRDTKA